MMIVERKRSDLHKEEFRAGKRRRTAILDAFQSISLNQEQLPREESMSTSASSHFDDIGYDGGGDDDICDGSIECDEATLLSDREEMERQVMFDLAFGRPTGTRRHPVDEKVEQWIRRDFLSKHRFERNFITSSTTPHQDDMHLDHAVVYREQSESLSSPTVRSSCLQRSHSMSNLDDVDDDAMDIDMIG